MSATRDRGFGPLRAAAVAQELASHALLFGLAWWSGAGYLGLMLLLAIEAPLVTLFTIPLYPQRGWRRHLGDLVKITFLMLFLLVFAVAAASMARGAATPGGEAVAPSEVLDLDPGLLGLAMAFTAAHLGLLRLLARRHSDPRTQWARLVLSQGAVTVVAMLFLAFAGPLMAAVLLPPWLAFRPQADPQLPLMLLAAAIRCGVGVLMSTMPERELAQMARNPYVD